MRLLHFSDVHVPSPPGSVPLAALASRRLMGVVNYRLRRRRRYLDAPRKLRELADAVRRWDVDVALCTGDYTIVGTDRELAHARRCVQPIIDAAPATVTVYGNHDVYMPDSFAAFERHFGDLLVNELPEVAVDGRWPMVRFFGERVVVVCVDSARPKPDLVRSTGRVPEAQLEALPKVLGHPRLKGRFVFLLTHYAPRLANGKPDKASHGLENADALLRASDGPRGALLFGHVHHRYHVRVPETSLTLFDSGSTTMRGHEGLWVFDVEGDRVVATPGAYEDGYVLRERERIVLA